jgi:hypothetical protein
VIRRLFALVLIVLSVSFANQPSVYAGGDLPFPLGKVVPLKSAEHWFTPGFPVLFETQLVKIDGHKGTLIRASSDEGFILDQTFVPVGHGPVETDLMLQAGETVHFTRVQHHQSVHAYITDSAGEMIFLERTP